MLGRIYKSITRQKWELGFVRNSLEEIVKGNPLNVEWVKHDYKDRWFADPFILDVTHDEIILLVEELKYMDNKGVISRIVVDRHSLKIIERKMILELSTHLSFPAIIRKDNRIYIYPENSASGKLKLYEYDVNKDKCIEIKVLCDAPLTDAILLSYENDKYIFSTKLSNPNGQEVDVYKLTDGGFIPYSKFKFNESIARNAGDFFILNEKIFRPAQECNSKYGHSISIQELSVADGNITLTEVTRLSNPSKYMTEGFHTLNSYKGITVIDVRGFNHYRVGKFLFRLKNCFN